jgi:hypothetical protein
MMVLTLFFWCFERNGAMTRITNFIFLSRDQNCRLLLTGAFPIHQALNCSVTLSRVETLEKSKLVYTLSIKSSLAGETQFRVKRSQHQSTYPSQRR